MEIVLLLLLLLLEEQHLEWNWVGSIIQCSQTSFNISPESKAGEFLHRFSLLLSISDDGFVKRYLSIFGTVLTAFLSISAYWK